MEEKEEEEEEEEEVVRERIENYIRREVKDWDDEEKCRARFKALSGQRCDWEAIYIFWRDLIIKVARHLGIFIIRPSQLNHLWFRHPCHCQPPLCLNHVLFEMHRSGDLLPFNPSTTITNTITNTSSSTTTTALFSQLFHKAFYFFSFITNTYDDDDDQQHSLPQQDYYIIAPLLEEHSLNILNALSQTHWTPSCVITISKFHNICFVGQREALAILDHLSKTRRATLLTINNSTDHVIQGVKICLVAPGGAVSSSTTDYSVLHLTWTLENLEKRLHLIDQRYQKTRNLASASLKSGNKRAALRYAKELKLASLGRERCTALLDRVENVLQVITDAESSKKVGTDRYYYLYM